MPLEEPDIVVVGAGIVGLAVALDGPIKDADVRAAAAPLPDAAANGTPSVIDALRSAVSRERIAA